MTKISKPNYAQIEFNENGTPVSQQFDDIYFSNDDGVLETEYVFLDKNNIPGCWASFDKPVFVIAETGFGTGLNFLTTWLNYDKAKANNTNPTASLHFYSFEKYPIKKTDLAKAWQKQPLLKEYADKLLDLYPDNVTHTIELTFENNIKLTVFIGDVNELIPELNSNVMQPVNAWYLDGFAPSKNPEMWQQSLFDNMARLSDNNATVATFTAAGFVRRGLQQAGFEMKKHKGFGHKREMIAGTLGNG